MLPDLYLFVVIICGLEAGGEVTCIQGIDNDIPVPLAICSQQLREKAVPIMANVINLQVVSFQAYCHRVPKPGQEINLQRDAQRFYK